VGAAGGGGDEARTRVDATFEYGALSIVGFDAVEGVDGAGRRVVGLSA
jgi:hypothetical protein